MMFQKARENSTPKATAATLTTLLALASCAPEQENESLREQQKSTVTRPLPETHTPTLRPLTTGESSTAEGVQEIAEQQAESRQTNNRQTHNQQSNEISEEQRLIAEAKYVFENWNAADESGNWVVTVKEREQAVLTVQEVLGLPLDTELTLTNDGKGASILTSDGKLQGEILFDKRQERPGVEYSYNFNSGERTLLSKKFDETGFRKEYDRVATALKPHYSELISKDILFSGPQRRSDDTVYLPILTYSGNRPYPAVILPSVVDLETGECEHQTRGKALSELLPEISHTLRDIQLGVGEVFEVSNEGKGSRVKVTNRWPTSEHEEAPEFNIALDFFLHESGEVRVTNANLSIREFGEQLNEALQITRHHGADSCEVAFASNTLSAVILPKATTSRDTANEDTANKDNSGLPFDLVILERDNRGYLRAERFDPKEHTENTYKSDKYEVEYYPGHNAFSINGRFAIRAMAIVQNN